MIAIIINSVSNIVTCSLFSIFVVLLQGCREKDGSGGGLLLLTRFGSIGTTLFSPIRHYFPYAVSNL